MMKRSSLLGGMSLTVVLAASCVRSNESHRSAVQVQIAAQAPGAGLGFGGCSRLRVAVTTGGEQVCALLSDGTAECFGANDRGQLGAGFVSVTPVDSPVPVASLSGATAIASGEAHSCAIVLGGGVVCWGTNDNGELGRGDTQPSLTPVAVPGLSGVMAVGAGSNFTCALLGDGSVQCWGANDGGQLGNGTGQPSTTPVAVSGISGATALSVGTGHACVLMPGGSVLCWGGNFDGQVGDPDSIQSFRPVPFALPGLSGLRKIATGAAHTCALLADGTVACWGDGSLGEFGNGLGVFADASAPTSTTPVTVPGLAGVVDLGIAEGAHSTCALLGTGAVWCWGDDEFGQLGNGTVSPPSAPGVPAAVVGLSGATAVAIAGNHACATTSDGGLYCWGRGLSGFLGPGALASSDTPVAIAGGGVSSAGQLCRPTAGACDVAETCDGLTSDCPADTLAPVGRVCRGTLGTCAGAAACTGISSDCPPNTVPDGGAGCADASNPDSGLGGADAGIGAGGHGGGGVDAAAGAANGSSCLLPGDCASGICEDSVCCATACGGDPTDCQACSTSAGGSANGTCTLLTANTVCGPGSTGDLCQISGTCSGSDPTCLGPSTLPSTECLSFSPPGSPSVPIDFLGGDGVPGGVSITFAGPTDASTLEVKVIESSSGPPPPPGFEIASTSGDGGSAPIYWYIDATPGYQAPTVCIGIDPAHWGATCTLAMDHDPGTGFTSVTTSRCDANKHLCDSPSLTCPVANVICGTTTHFSPFIIVKPIATPPIVTVPSNMVAEASGPAGAAVTYAATATDAEDGVLTPICTPASGATFPIGTTTVTCTATDQEGLSSSSSFTVSIRDTTGPFWKNVPATLVAYATSTRGAKVTYTNPTATDAVDGVRPVTCRPGSGSTFLVNQTTVTCTAADKSGNASSAKFIVWVQYQVPTDGAFFLLPLLPKGNAVFPIGLPVPVLFRLTGASAGITNLAATFSATKVSSAVQGNVAATSTATITAFDAWTTFAYDPLVRGYLYLWRTSNQAEGTYQLTANLGDGVTHQIDLSLKELKP